jgi:hypothetical protein
LRFGMPSGWRTAGDSHTTITNAALHIAALRDKRLVNAWRSRLVQGF